MGRKEGRDQKRSSTAFGGKGEGQGKNPSGGGAFRFLAALEGQQWRKSTESRNYTQPSSGKRKLTASPQGVPFGQTKKTWGSCFWGSGPACGRKKTWPPAGLRTGALMLEYANPRGGNSEIGPSNTKGKKARSTPAGKLLNRLLANEGKEDQEGETVARSAGEVQAST